MDVGQPARFGQTGRRPHGHVAGDDPERLAPVCHYAAGGRTIESGPNAGVGSENPFKSEFVNGFTLSPSERADLIAFLESLTDTTFTTNPALSNPWSRP